MPKNTITIREYLGEKYLRQTSSQTECVAAAVASSAKANGATWGPGNKKCYAEFGETGHDNSASWTTCVFGATASKPCYRSVPAPNTVVGKHLSGQRTGFCRPHLTLWVRCDAQDVKLLALR